METSGPAPAVDADGVPVGPALNPAQAEILAALGARPHERPAFDPRLRESLRAELDERLGSVAASATERDPLWISKHLLSSVHGCEALFLAQDEEPFAWTPASARGAVAHKAIELATSWRGDPAPGVLVDEGLARLVESPGTLGQYLGQLGEGERAELHAAATERVSMFQECFPPLEPRWRPVPESRLRAELCGGRVVLAGKVDLTVGRPEGVRAGKVLIDLKTGGFSPHHVDDLRFYALIEALRLGVPPRLLATYYLDGGRLQSEAVTEAILATTVERVVRGATAAAELRAAQRAPVLRPGPPCRWCPVVATCEAGRRWLEEDAEARGWALDEVEGDGA